MTKPTESRTAYSLLGEPLHRMLNKVPIGSFVAGTLLQGLGTFRASPGLLLSSFYVDAIGLAFVPLVAFLGYLDWRKIRLSRREAGTQAFGHGWIMIGCSVLYFYSWIIRFDSPSEIVPGSLGVALAGFACLVLGGAVGARLVTEYGIGTAADTARALQLRQKAASKSTALIDGKIVPKTSKRGNA